MLAGSPNLLAHPQKILDLVANSLNVNSTAGETKNKEGEIIITGSKTEIAILEFWKKLGYSYQTDRENTDIINIVPFSSDRKRMTCVVKYMIEDEIGLMKHRGSTFIDNQGKVINYEKTRSLKLKYHKITNREKKGVATVLWLKDVPFPFGFLPVT